jgi:hypothetical protein
MGTIKKERAGYVYSPGSDYTCGECAFYESGKCLLYKKPGNDVETYGSCILWQPDVKGVEIPQIGTTNKKDTGYEENKPGFSCKRCEYFLYEEMDCKKVDKNSAGATPGQIRSGACCNFWDKE